MAVGGVVVLAVIAALVIAALPSGTRSEPTGPTERVANPKGDPKGSAPGTNGGTKEGLPEPTGDPPEPQGKPPGPKIVVSAPKPGEAREIEIAPGVKMTFCWIPPGTAMLGFPQGEAGRTKDEVEHEYTSKGFWMGKYTVTQAEWKAVMGDNPSSFDGTKDNKAKGMDTSRFPVESVSWDRIYGAGKSVGEGFLNKINHGGIETAFGRAGKFRLPQEDEWEYAARGGRGNTQPFYWGKELNASLFTLRPRPQ